MYQYATLPFPRGETYKSNAGDNITMAADTGASLVGQTFEQPDLVHGTGRVLTLRIVRNESGGALTVATIANRFLSYRATTAYDVGSVVDGISGTVSEGARPIDDFYAEKTNLVTIPVHDLFYVIDSGPAYCITAAASASLAHGVPVTNDALGALQNTLALGGQVVQGLYMGAATDVEDLKVPVDILPYRSAVADATA